MVQLQANAASVTFDRVTKKYGAVTAVDAVSLEIETGRLVTLLGPSGCGKTTTLRMIAGLEMPSSGRILIGDKDVTKLPATDRDVSMVFQSYALFPHMNVLENVSYGLRFSGFGKREIGERAAAGLQLVGLTGYERRLPSELSGGQQQRVAVARALVLEPQVLLFDEPLSNLDAKLRRRVREEIREIQTKLGLTVVYVTHDQEEALAVSDRIIVMNNASIAQQGTPRELYDEPANAFVADFIGEANLFDCRVAAIDGNSAEVELGPLRLRLPAGGHAVGPAKLAARPNQIGLTSPGTDGTLPGTVRQSTYVGRHVEFVVETGHGDVFVTSPDVETIPEPGSAVGLAFPARGPVLISG